MLRTRARRTFSTSPARTTAVAASRQPFDPDAPTPPLSRILKNGRCRAEGRSKLRSKELSSCWNLRPLQRLALPAPPTPSWMLLPFVKVGNASVSFHLPSKKENPTASINAEQTGVHRHPLLLTYFEGRQIESGPGTQFFVLTEERIDNLFPTSVSLNSSNLGGIDSDSQFS